MRAHYLLWIIVGGAAIVSLGCQESSGGSSAGAPSASAAVAPASAPVPSVSASAATARPHPRFGRHGGIASALFRAARDLTDLSQTQQDSLDKVETALKDGDDGLRAAMRAFRSDLVAGVHAGKLDTAKLAVDDGPVDRAIADHRAREAGALDSLHALLGVPQRAALVAAVKARQAEHEARVAEWLQAKEADGGALDWTKRRLDRLTTDLSLDAAQQKQVAAILARASEPPGAAGMQARWQDHKKKADAVLAAFGSDPFDAKKLDLGVMPGKTAHDAMDHMVAFFSQLLPVLHSDQRDKLATSVDRPFGERMGGMGAMHGMPLMHGMTDEFAFPFVEPGEWGGPPRE